jgi:selenide,water dikinase
MNSRLPNKELVLLGVGHTHAHIVAMWRMNALPGVRLTCISDRPFSTYSGMLPAVLAGQVSEERMQIDLVRLCASAGVRLIIGETTGLDLDHSRVLLRERPPLHFDALSVGTGSTPITLPGLEDSPSAVVIKPMQTFLPRLDAAIATLEEVANSRPLQIAIVGAGAGGLEIAYCLPAYLARRLTGAQQAQISLVDRAPTFGGGMPAALARTARQELDRKKIAFVGSKTVQAMEADGLRLDDGQLHKADLVLWAASASAPKLLGKLGLPLDPHGFLEVSSDLKTTAGRPIFAVGDSAGFRDDRVPKAGVYAVRQGPVLWHNLKATLQRRQLKEFRPQQDFLKLLNLGDGRAIASYRGYANASKTAWSLKQFIDGRFLDKFQRYQAPDLAGMSGARAEVPTEIPCAGCGGKVGAPILTRVLHRLAEERPGVASQQLRSCQDVVAIEQLPGATTVINTDFFAPPLNDDFLSGRVAALNALSDFYAAGANPREASAIVALPRGAARSQEETLYQLLSGAAVEFASAGVTLIGGHTVESDGALIGFTITGSADQSMRTKSALKVGQDLVITKPLGTGVLLSSAMQAACRSDWHEAMLASMLTSNRGASIAATTRNCIASTDITGFGLAGHLLEMLDASNVGATLHLAQIPLLPGCEELMASGFHSTLAPSNRESRNRIDDDAKTRNLPAYEALFDPQTSGGLLLAVAPEDRGLLLEALTASGLVSAAWVGSVTERDNVERPLTIR